MPAGEFLPALARACRCAALHTDGVLEPLYRLHATRLKLLLAREDDAQLLQQLARRVLRAQSASLPRDLPGAGHASDLVASLQEQWQAR